MIINIIIKHAMIISNLFQLFSLNTEGIKNIQEYNIGKYTGINNDLFTINKIINIRLIFNINSIIFLKIRKFIL